MTRTITALAFAGVLLLASPAAAHLKVYEDSSNDAYQGGQTNTTAHTTPLDLSGMSFREKPGNYKFKLFLHDPLDSDLLCSEATCGKSIESHGLFFADFYRFVDDVKKNWYFIQGASDGEGGLVAGLFKVTPSGNQFIENATALLSDDGTTVTLKASRDEISGHKEGRKIYINTTSVFWEASDADHCVFDSNEPFANGCVDWVPNLEDAPHKLQN